jgi:hypothetical protein
MNVQLNTLRIPRSRRVGRTAGWPAMVGWVRWVPPGRIVGVIVRVGGRALYVWTSP